MVFKSKSQYLALLVAFWRRQVSTSFDCNLIFDDNGSPHGLSPRPFLFLLCTSSYWDSQVQGFYYSFPNFEGLDVLEDFNNF